MTDALAPPVGNHVLAGGGEMGALMRAFNWSATPIGPVETWPQSLRTTLDIMLTSRFPMFLWWGPERIQFYNDGYRPSLGANKHPGALGQHGEECWAEIWPVIGPMVDAVYTRGESFWHEDQLIPIDRNGYMEEVFWTYSYSPIRLEDGTVGGTLVVVSETTPRVQAERRLATLRDLTATTASAKDEREACRLAAVALARNNSDVPFTLLYLLDPDGKRAHLAASAGLVAGTAAAPSQVDLDTAGNGNNGGYARQDEGGWPLARVARSGKQERVDHLAMLFEPLPAGPWPEPTTAALMLPFGQGGQGGPPSADTAAEGEVAPRGVLIAGLSPRIPMTDAYRNFFEVVTGQLTTAIANAWADQVTAKQRLDELTSELQEQLDAHVQLNAELREIGVEWERMLAEARAAARMRDEFLSAAAHDLRTPLTSIHGHAQLLQRQAARPGGVPADRLLSGIGQIQNAVAQMQRLVNDVVDVGRLQAGQSLSLDRQPADLVQLTQRAAQKHQQTTARHQIIVEAPALSLVGAWDARRLERVLDNLLSNALKYSPDGGPVTLFVTLTPPQPHEDIRWAALRVRDTGIGIPAAELAGIFDHFSHASNVQDQIRGSGIGLASVRQIVEQHGGAVSVESEEGKGSTFTVRLPL